MFFIGSYLWRQVSVNILLHYRHLPSAASEGKIDLTPILPILRHHTPHHTCFTRFYPQIPRPHWNWGHFPGCILTWKVSTLVTAQHQSLKVTTGFDVFQPCRDMRSCLKANRQSQGVPKTELTICSVCGFWLLNEFNCPCCLSYRSWEMRMIPYVFHLRLQTASVMSCFWHQLRTPQAGFSAQSVFRVIKNWRTLPIPISIILFLVRNFW